MIAARHQARRAEPCGVARTVTDLLTPPSRSARTSSTMRRRTSDRHGGRVLGIGGLLLPLRGNSIHPSVPMKEVT
jgi:hypothetical protein